MVLRARRRFRMLAGGAASVVMAVTGVALALPASAAVSLTVTTTADVATNAGDCANSSTTVPSPLSLREATCIANNYGSTQAVTINVPAGHYTLLNGELQPGMVPGSNISIVGAGSASTILDGHDSGRVFDLDPTIAGGVTTAISDLEVTGGFDDTYGGAGIIGGSNLDSAADSLTLTNVVVTANNANPSDATATNKPGGGIQFLGGRLTITNSTISNNTSGSSSGSGVAYGANGLASPEGLTITGTTFSGNSAKHSSDAIENGGALYVFGTPTSTFTVSNSRFTGNAVTATAGQGPAVGAAIWQESGQLTVTGSTFTGNSVAGGNGPTGGAIRDTSGAATTLHYNRFVGNTAPSGGALSVGSGATSVSATENWWGCNTGPGTSGCDTTTGTATVAPRLVLTATASPSHVVHPSTTSTLTASLLTDSAGGAVSASNLSSAFDGLPVSFADPPGDATVGGSAGAHSVNLASGVASIGYQSNTTLGPDNDLVTLDNGTATDVLEVDEPPTIASANIAHFTVGSSGSFTITTTGYPAAAVTETGSLPSGLTFHDNGDGSATISGTPGAGTGGNYTLNLTAANGYLPNASQTLTVNVSQPPGFTSPATATFVIGSSGSFNVTTSGFPTVSTITESGTLPAGVTFTDNGNGTATLAGTPTGTGNTYPVSLTAANGVTPDGTQNLTVQVNQAPAITLDPTDQTVSPGNSVSFTAAASGVPTPTVQWQVSTDGGTSFANIAGATSTTYTFTAATGDNGKQYRAVFSNGVGSPATTTAATLSVGTAPTFTSADHTSFVVGQAGSFTITTTGVPDATLSRTGAQFPAWLTLTDNGDGTGALTGTPPAGSAGTYQFTLKAANGFSPSASQNFTLFVDDSPVITSADHTTFTVGQAGTFAVTTTAGFPTTTAITETGSLPSGVTFTDNGDGTATLAGTAAAGTGGTYAITVTATAVGGLASPTTQNFTLTVLAPPVITSADHTTFAVGSAGTFTVTTTAGNPAATTLGESGSLPSGVTFTDNGDGTATLAGTPAAGTGGSYPITITAGNGVTPDPTQSFTLTVTAVPSITSADHTTFTAGSAGSFTVTSADAFPAATTLTETGALPSGVTFTDNGDGTATLAGTPAAGTGGSYPLTLTATNTVGHSNQAFTLTVSQSPAITSADHTTFAVGSAGTFTVTTTPGVPAATTVTHTGALPSGVTFTDNGDGTATLAGTPAAGTGGSYPITVTAGNGATPDATQSFTLTVTELPAVTSADHAGFGVGTLSSFTVTSSAGFPTATTLTETGALPSGVTFTDNGDGTATLAGTPAAGTAGSYPLTLTATNTTGHTDQAFTLVVGLESQTITDTSTPPAPGTVGTSYQPTAGSDSGLPVAFSIDPATTGNACSITGTTVSFDHAGLCVVDENQAGDGTYAPAQQVQETINVVARPTTLTLTPSVASAAYGQPVVATAAVTSTGAATDGTVQFSVDGNSLGTPVAVNSGQATSAPLTDGAGNPLSPGSHAITAAFTPADPTTEAAATGGYTQVVNQGATTTSVMVQSGTITAGVAGVSPAVGDPTGTVTFSVGGTQVGTATVHSGTAALNYTVPAVDATQVSAVYSGDTNFTGSSASLTRHNPAITATVTSAKPKSSFGWYRTPVTVTFQCTPAGAALTGPCPDAVELTANGAAQSVTRTITAVDGGVGTVVVSGINIDQIAPTVQVVGVRNGATYAGVAPRVRCLARDTLSGVASCKVRLHRSGTTTTYRVTATDKAGNTTTKTGRYHTLGIFIANAKLRHGAFLVVAGHTYTVIVTGAGHRPVYYDAAPVPRRPSPRDNAFHPAGHHRWAIGVTLEPSLVSHPRWNIGIKIGSRMHILVLQVVR